MAILAAFSAASYFDQSLVHTAPVGATRAYAVVKQQGAVGDATLTLGGNAMTEVAERVNWSYGGFSTVVYRLNTPPSGTQALSVTAGTVRGLAIIYLDDTGAERTPVTGTTTETTNDPSLTVDSGATDTVLLFVAVHQNGGSITDIAATGGSTRQTQGHSDGVSIAIFSRAGASPTQSIACDVQSTVAHSWGAIALSIESASGGVSSPDVADTAALTEAATLGLSLPVSTESVALVETVTLSFDGEAVPGPGTGNLVGAPVPHVLPAQPSPLVVWGTPDSFSGWSDSNTTRTTGQADPWGGTTAMTLAESSANGWAGSATWVASRAGAGPSVAVWFKQSGGSTQTTLVQLWDATAGAARAQGTVTWSSANLASYAQQAGTMLLPLSVGNGWWLLRFVGTGTVAGNTMRLVIYPGSASIRVAARPTVLLGPLDTVRAWAQAREGSTRVRGASGVEDGWDYGRDYVLSGRIRRAASFDLAEPEPVSGWDGGTAEHPAVGYGLSRMFADGQVGTEYRVSPHYQQAATVQVTAWLGNVTGEPANEDNGTQAADVAFRALVPWTGVLA